MKTSVGVRPRAPKRSAAPTTTLVHVGEQVVRVVQVRHAPTGPELLTLKTRPTAALTPEAVTTLARSLPAAPGRIILVLSKTQVLIRYLTLPADDPGELVTMARYAVADGLPYAIEDCVVAVQRLQSVEKKTKVLAVITPKATLERLLTLLQPAGLTPQAIALSSEGLVRWHQCLLPSDGPGPRLVLEALGDTLELAIVERDRLLSMRSLPLPAPALSAAWLVTQVQETLQGYTQERLGPAVTALTVSGPTVSAQGMVAALSEHLNVPVTVADPTAGPFTQALAHDAEALTAQPWSDLFGLALAPTPLALDLLPADVKQTHALEATYRVALHVLTWVGVCAWLGAAACGVAGLRHARWQQALTPRTATEMAARAHTLARYLERITAAQGAYAAQMTLLTDLQSSLPPTVTLEQITLAGAHLTVQGSASTLGDVLQAVAQWSRLPSLTDLTLQHATAEQGGRIRFTGEARRR